MSFSLPDPEEYGKSETKPWEKIDSDNYTSLFDFEDKNE